MSSVFGNYSNSPIFPLLLISMFVAAGARSVEAQQGRLPDHEVDALKEIAKQLGKTNWNFNVDPCSGEFSWTTPKMAVNQLYNNSVNCSCDYPGGQCHVVSMFLKGEDLAGVLPPAIAKLSNLKNIDFTRNYLGGIIPAEWTSLKLEILSLTANRLSGPIPPYLGNFTSLIFLSIENNLFTGTVPAELGKLVNLEDLILNANNLTGDLPQALTNLTKLKQLRISSNNFSGKLPNFFQSWKHLEKLEIQASGFEGPIPSSISVLSNLTELRISDMNCEGSTFPPLRNMSGIKRLMLRSCNISGPIPIYVAEEMTQLIIL